VDLIVFETFAPFRNRWNVTHRNPPQAVVRLIHLFKPLGAFPENFDVSRGIHVAAKKFEGFPDGHIHENKRVVIVRNISGVASGRLEPPDKAGSGISESIDGIKLGDKASDLRIVDGGKNAADIDLCQVEVHGRDSTGESRWQQ
jgi:hypothetical protein